jgi:hypothetical protein
MRDVMTITRVFFCLWNRISLLSLAVKNYQTQYIKNVIRLLLTQILVNFAKGI